MSKRTLCPKIDEVLEHILNGRLMLDHGIRDASDLGDARGDEHTGIDKLRIPVGDTTVTNLHRTDFGDAITLRAQTGGLKVQGDVILGESFGGPSDQRHSCSFRSRIAMTPPWSVTVAYRVNSVDISSTHESNACHAANTQY